MRLIDVDALRADYGMAEDCKNCKTGYRSCEYDRIYSKMDFCGWLDDAPTVDAVPVRHGRWIRHDYADIVDGYYVPEYECSECHSWKKGDSDYCPDCGARMDGKDGEQNEGVES